jgi:hypothetical protein
MTGWGRSRMTTPDSIYATAQRMLADGRVNGPP